MTRSCGTLSASGSRTSSATSTSPAARSRSSRLRSSRSETRSDRGASAQNVTVNGASTRRFQRRAHADAKLALAGRGIETACLTERALQGAQRLPDRTGNRPGERRRGDASALPLEQRIPQQVAQSPKRVADRGLGQVQLAAGHRDAALGVDRVEDHQQVHVDS